MKTDKSTFNALELKSHVEQILVPHTAFQEATKALEQAFEAVPIIRDSLGYFIAGESRTGKSRLIEEFAAAHPWSREPDGLLRPVARVQVPSKPTIKGLASEILLVLEDPLYNKGTEQEKTARILMYLKKCKVKVLIIDECQQLIDKESSYRLIHHVSDWIKTLLNSSKIIIVVVGLHYTQMMLSQNEQLRGRFMNKITIPRFDWRNEKSRSEFLGVLAGFNELLAEKFSLPDLYESEMAIRFYLASGGLVGYVFNMLRQVVWDVVDDNRTIIMLEDLARSYEVVVDDDDKHPLNPFTREFDFNNGIAFEKALKVGTLEQYLAPRKSKNSSILNIIH